jgi:putative Mn2+ efflux pump MntP
MEEQKDRIKSAKINNVLGLFVLFFCVVIIVAIFFTETFIGQMANLVAGIILSLIGGAMMITARRTLKIFK